MKELPSGRLDRRILTSWRVEGVIGTFFIGLFTIVPVLIARAMFPDMPAWSLMAALAVPVIWLILFVFVIPPIRYSRWRYAVDEDEVDLVRGLIIVSRTIIPLVRVQHVDSSRGPILRWLGLANVSVATAAGVHTIPALSLEEADALRDRIAAWARVAQEDV